MMAILLLVFIATVANAYEENSFPTRNFRHDGTLYRFPTESQMQYQNAAQQAPQRNLIGETVHDLRTTTQKPFVQPPNHHNQQQQQQLSPLEQIQQTQVFGYIQPPHLEYRFGNGPIPRVPTFARNNFLQNHY